MDAREDETVRLSFTREDPGDGLVPGKFGVESMPDITRRTWRLWPLYMDKISTPTGDDGPDEVSHNSYVVTTGVEEGCGGAPRYPE